MNIVVVGSLNMDAVIPVLRYPGPGETVTGGDVQFVCGGKGANQAVAAARLGANVIHLGMVGQDANGAELKRNLSADGVDTNFISTWDGPSGMAFIHLESDGTNRIILSPGANAQLLPEVVRPVEYLIRQADALMIQLEIPMETVQYVLNVAHATGIPTFLDPAPARDDLFDYITRADWITPNESEAEILTGQPVSDTKTAGIAAAKLQQMGARRVLLKMGAQGACVADENEVFFHPGFSVKAVDTTAAGDAFGAAFVIAWLQHHNIQQALRSACATGALTATRIGAQASLPHQKEVQAFLANL